MSGESMLIPIESNMNWGFPCIIALFTHFIKQSIFWGQLHDVIWSAKRQATSSPIYSHHAHLWQSLATTNSKTLILVPNSVS
jgi:hypothetical protein